MSKQRIRAETLQFIKKMGGYNGSVSIGAGKCRIGVVYSRK